jgi:ribonuclease HI
VEDAFHASVACTKARALRDAMRKEWKLPDEAMFRKTGEDWLQNLLYNIDSETRARLLLLLWRAWHLRNDVVHHNGKETIASSVAFLLAHRQSTNIQTRQPMDSKGKNLMVDDTADEARSATRAVWTPPPPGWLKLNTDGSLKNKCNTGGAGAIARNSKGEVLFAACKPLPLCSTPEEAEVRAALLGLSTLKNQEQVKLILEVDNTTVAKALQAKTTDRSRYWTFYEEAKLLLSNLEASVVLFSGRETNRVADSLAKLACSLGEREMREDLPVSVRDLVSDESNQCNHI